MILNKTWYELEPSERRGIIAVGLFWLVVILTFIIPSVAFSVLLYVSKAAISLMVIGVFSFMVYRLVSAF